MDRAGTLLHLVKKAVLWSNFSAKGPRWLLRAVTGVARACGHVLFKVLLNTPIHTTAYKHFRVLRCHSRSGTRCDGTPWVVDDPLYDRQGRAVIIIVTENDGSTRRVHQSRALLLFEAAVGVVEELGHRARVCHLYVALCF